MNIGAIMNVNVITVDVDETVEGVRNRFRSHDFHHLLVMDHGCLVGVISDRDLLRNISPFLGSLYGEQTRDVDLLNRRAHQIMTHRPVTATPATPVADAAHTMLRKSISCLPIVDEKRRPVGIVTARDLLRTLVESAKREPTLEAAAHS